MKKIGLLLVVIVAMVVSGFSQETVNVGIDWTGAPVWNQYNPLHVVAKGSSYDYAVEKHLTKTLAQIKASEAGNTNRYYWEVLKVTVNEAVTPMTYAFAPGVTPQIFDTFPAVQDHFKTLSWTQDKGDFYLIRVSEFANHADENTNPASLQADLNSKNISEILVKIGDVLNIHIPTDITMNVAGLTDVQNGINAYLCVADTPTPDMFDGRFAATRFKCNGRPVDGKFKVFLSVLKTKEGEANTATTISIEKPVTLVDNYNVVDGYYSLDISLADINSKTVLDLDATDNDIYYEITVLGYKHADTDPAEEFSASVGSSVGAPNEKASRIYAVYTSPKITKINHK